MIKRLVFSTYLCVLCFGTRYLVTPIDLHDILWPSPVMIEMLLAPFRRPQVLWRRLELNVKRTYSQTTDPEAHLENIKSHPGITCLSLNRPQAKNAISLRLLKVIRVLQLFL